MLNLEVDMGRVRVSLFLGRCFLSLKIMALMTYHIEELSSCFMTFVKSCNSEQKPRRLDSVGQRHFQYVCLCVIG